MKKYVAVLLGLAFCGLGNFAQAGDIEAGKSKASTCAGCHGVDGNSLNPQWPSLAGQNNYYLAQQLKAYRDGSRTHAVMQSMAQGLSDQDIEDLAAYYASLTPKSAGGGDGVLIEAGEGKYAACMHCHGKKGEGLGASPRLAGQQPAYIVQQLKDYKSGARSSPIMKPFASNLSEADMRAIAAYLATLK